MSYKDVFTRLGLWLLVTTWGLSSVAAVAAPDKDKDKKPRQTQETAASKNVPGSCQPGTAGADLNVNNVNARLFNTGSLFYSKSDDSRYEVPQGGDVAPIYAHGIWVGGMVGDELRMAAATYAQGGEDWEFFPGSLKADGTLDQPDCTQADRLYKVSRTDIVAMNNGGQPTQDIIDWPWQKGAPVYDGDGNPNNYNLGGGDRPGLIGDQTIWWVMNDVGGKHLTTQTNPLGLEVQVTAFAFNTADALNNTTFYKYKFIYKPQAEDAGESIKDMWVGLWSDPDLGNAGDDYVGSDPTLGLGYVYNGDSFDETSHGYGNRPPALGYDFFQGPLVDNDGLDNNGDETVDEPGERLQMTRFLYYNNDNSANNGNPDGADDYYGYLKGLWRDNSCMTVGGDGQGGSECTHFMFPGTPPAFWSEDNVDGRGGRNTPSDRRFLMSTGPFEMKPGDVQELVFGIVWSQTLNRHGSVMQLKADDILAQGAFDFDFNLPPPPDKPELTATELDNTIVLNWNNAVTSNNYLNQYDEPSPFLADVNASDTTYTFEGYMIYQYANEQDTEGQLIATYDVANNITTIVDEFIDPNTGAPVSGVSAKGTDSGVKNFFIVDKDFINDADLHNFTEYHFGVQAYAYNAASKPLIRKSPITRVSAVPQAVDARFGGAVVQSEAGSTTIRGTINKVADAIISATVTDPLAVKGDQYTVSFYQYDPEGDAPAFMTYDIKNAGTGAVLASGSDTYEETGKQLPFGDNVLTAGGLAWTIKNPAAGFGTGAGIVEVKYAGNPVNTDAAGAPYGGNAVWHGLNSNRTYYVTAGGGAGELARLERWARFASPYDFEMRFTEEGSYGVHAFSDETVTKLPFEIWNIGISTPNDPSDDVQMIPFISENEASGASFGWATGEDAWAGYPISDWIYWMDPLDANGYDNFAAVAEASGAGNAYNWDLDTSEEGMFINWHGGFVYPIGRFAIADFGDTGTPPPAGTVIRLHTTKPITAGDVFTVNTAAVGTVTDSAAVAVAALDRITVVPNPYRGASTYDKGPGQDEVRITYLPVGSRVRVYSINGLLLFEDTQRSPDGYYAWDLRTNDLQPIASGMYLIHVEVPNVGERVLKFGVVKKTVNLDVF